MSQNILEFSRWLKQAMQDAGLSQSQLAQRSGVSKQYINGLLAPADGRESKTQQPSVEKVEALAKALTKPISEARLLAGWASEPVDLITGESSLLAIYRALSDDRREDLLAFAETLYRRHSKVSQAGKTMDEGQRAIQKGGGSEVEVHLKEKAS